MAQDARPTSLTDHTVARVCCDIENLNAEGDQAVARTMFSGIHRAPFLGVPATGRRVTWAGAAFFTFQDGLVNDLWVLGDPHSLHQQLNRPADV